MELNRKGYYYSLDALVAIVVIFSVLITVKIIVHPPVYESNLQEDLLQALSSLKMNELNNSYAALLLSENKANPNNTVLEQITELYAKELPEARILASSIFEQLNSSENIGIWFNNELIASTNSSAIENASQILVANQMMSGLEKGGSIKGFSARAFLQKAQQVKYFYFGGYVGDGNVSINVNYDGEIKDLALEIAVNTDFDIYINDLYSGHYEKSPSELTPAKYSIGSYITRLTSGSNTIKIVGPQLYIAGGFIKLIFDSATADLTQNTVYLPGIKGVINYYDGISIPYNLTSMEIFIHYFSNRSTFMTFGNTTLFNETRDTEQTKLIDDSSLRAMFNYNTLEGKTLPIRIGLSEFLGGSGNADVILITDFSGSMKKAVGNWDQGNLGATCNDVYTDPFTRRTNLAKCVDKEFVDIILNNSGNSVWPVFIFSNSISSFSGNASNPAEVKAYINNYQNGKDQTCLGCAVNAAYTLLSSIGKPENKKYVILMTDGVPTHCALDSCFGNSSSYGTQYCAGLCDTTGSCSSSLDTNITSSCESCTVNSNPVNNLLYAVNRTIRDFKAIFHTVGFGPLDDCNLSKNTLQMIATNSGGMFNSSNSTQALRAIYRNFAEDILRISYNYQISNVSPNFVATTLYPDSYVKFITKQIPSPYGLIVSSESANFDESSKGSFFIPADSSILDASAISYSSSRWTNLVSINNFIFYNISEYGTNYNVLGDPYVIRIPNDKVLNGTNNVSLNTISQFNVSGGSSSDKVIYKIIKPISSYSPILPSAQGCIWTISDETNENTTMRVPQNYTGLSTCSFSPGNVYYNNNDAIDTAVHSLLRMLDFNNNEKVDSLIAQDDLQISASEVSGIPYAYASEVQVRTWR